MKLIIADSRHFWNNSPGYPFRTERPVYEPEAREVEETLGREHQFICCIFDGMVHWAFAEVESLKLFERKFPNPDKRGT